MSHTVLFEYFAHNMQPVIEINLLSSWRSLATATSDVKFLKKAKLGLYCWILAEAGIIHFTFKKQCSFLSIFDWTGKIVDSKDVHSWWLDKSFKYNVNNPYKAQVFYTIHFKNMYFKWATAKVHLHLQVSCFLPCWMPRVWMPPPFYFFSMFHKFPNTLVLLA